MLNARAARKGICILQIKFAPGWPPGNMASPNSEWRAANREKNCRRERSTIRYSLASLPRRRLKDVHAAHAVDEIDQPALVNGHIVGGGTLLALGGAAKEGAGLFRGRVCGG